MRWAICWRGDWPSLERVAPSTPLIRGHELPPYIITFEGLCLEYGFLGL